MLPLAVSFFCALLGEVFRSLMTSTPDDTRFQMMGNLYVAGGAIGVVFLSLMLWALKARQPGVGSILPKSEGLAIRTVLLVMIFGFVITALFNTSLFLGYTFFCAAFWCLRALSWMYSVRVAIHKGSSVLIVFGLSLSCFSLPVALSVSIMPQLTSAISNSAIPWASVVMVAITLLFVLTIFILDPKDIGTNWGLTLRTVQVSSLPQDRESALCFLKDEYRLTEREFDVALLLGKGRSLPFIQEELHIAEGTALTHLRHIYQKLGVHNRQEFITVIETAAKSQQESTGDYAEI
jgi:DNA-binding CsgD family transcriptional regulator